MTTFLSKDDFRSLKHLETLKNTLKNPEISKNHIQI